MRPKNGFAWKTRCSGGCHRPMSYTKNALSSVCRWQRVFRGCDLFGLKLKHKFPKIADDTLYFTLSSFNTDDIVISALSSFKTMTTFKLCSHLSAKMTSSKWRCYLFHRWQRIFCHLYSSMKDDNAENGVSSFKDHNVNYALSSFITDDVVIKTLSSAWQITTQQMESHLSKITTWNMACHLLLGKSQN